MSPAVQTDKRTACLAGVATRLNSLTLAGSASRGWCHEAVQHAIAAGVSLSFAASGRPSAAISLLADMHNVSHASVARGPTKRLYWT